jgi:hypothetical protein
MFNQYLFTSHFLTAVMTFYGTFDGIGVDTGVAFRVTKREFDSPRAKDRAVPHSVVMCNVGITI